MADVAEPSETLDTSDVDKHIGEMVGGGQLKEPIGVTDIRRWVQTMNYPNPRHIDEEAAAATPAGEIVAPQSFAACCDVGHGSVPAIVGRIPDTHAIFGGDEWWFYGPRIRPGDLIRVRRRFDGYRMAETKFAGPTMFSRGDTLFVNQRQESVGKLRSTMVRYRPDLARQRGFYDQSAAPPQFTADELSGFQQQQSEWVRSGESGAGPGEVGVGDTLPTRPIGPHTTASLTMEYRTFIYSVWGSHYFEGTFYGMDAGWLPEFSSGASADVRTTIRTGTSDGPSSGHTDLDKAKLVGLPRHYGYGTAIGAWVLDYLAYWAGDLGFVRHSKMDYRYPVFEGDIGLLNGEVTDVRFEPLLGIQIVTVRVRMTTQDDIVVAQGEAEVELGQM